MEGIRSDFGGGGVGRSGFKSKWVGKEVDPRRVHEKRLMVSQKWGINLFVCVCFFVY